MTNELMKISRTVAVFFLLIMLSISAASAMEYLGPANLEPQLSSDGKTMYNGVPAVVYRVDPNPPKGQARIPARFDMATLPETASSTFSITYAADGSTDPWDKSCVTFPEEAKAAFNAAAAIWGNLLNSSVPITISACWSDLGSPSILGYSGGGHLYRDFTNAPRANTWYGSSLANALAGSDLGPTYFDMYITYNSGFAWYYGTDGVTPAGQYDLMSVVLHEIAHGLNFSGSMSYSGGSGSWGGGTGYPNIYDTFMRDGTANPGNLLIDTGVYANPSTGLGSALTSNSIWFHGANAMAANGGQRVKMYAPSTWAGGSSYSHLDYTTFTGTANRLMVYAISSGVSTHDPGPITLGIFKDMGWPSGATVVPTVTTAAVTGVTATTATSGGNVTSSGGAAVTDRGVCWSTSGNPTTSDNCTHDGTGTGSFVSSITGLSANTPYHVRAYATNSAGTAYGLEQNFTTTDGTVQPNLLLNGDFESGNVSWTETNSAGYTNINLNTGLGHNGSNWYIYTGTVDNLTSSTSQVVSIPADASQAYAQFWYRINTDETTAVNVWDTMAVRIEDPSTGALRTTLTTLSNLDATSGWVESPQYNLAAYKGQTIRLNFLVETDESNPTRFRVDDAVIVATNLARNLSVSISGNGSVNSNPTGIACTTGNLGACAHQFANGTPLTLTAIGVNGPELLSHFGSWPAGVCDSVNGAVCSVTMNSDKNITATFITNQPVRIAGASYYPSLQAAYNGTAVTGGTIQAQAVALSALDFTLDSVPGKTVTLEGGYDSAYSINNSNTTMQGILTLGTGSLILENLIIK